MNSTETIAELHEVNDGVSGHLATVLYFRILVCSIGNGVLGLRFKFHQNRSIFAKVMALLREFKMADAAIMV